jgi:hypothetical protein
VSGLTEKHVCAVLLGAAFVASACSGGGDPSSVETRAPEPTTSQKTTTAQATTVAVEPEANPTEPPGGELERAVLPQPVDLYRRVEAVVPPATPRELRWFSRYSRWWQDTNEDLVLVARLSDELIAERIDETAGAGRLYEVLRRLRQCENDFFRTANRGSSERVGHLFVVTQDACLAVEGVAATGAQMLVHGVESADVRAWRAEWDAAGRLLIKALGEAAAYDPARAKPLPRRGGITEASRVEPAFSRASRAAAGKRVDVRCWSPEDWRKLIPKIRLYTGGRVGPRHGAFATIASSEVNLSPNACLGLVALAHTKLRPTRGIRQLALASSVATLAHESLHARGIADERLAECFGMQLLARTARALGADRRYAKGLARAYWKRGYPTLPRPYRSPECANGQAFDLRLHSPAWP